MPDTLTPVAELYHYPNLQANPSASPKKRWESARPNDTIREP